MPTPPAPVAPASSPGAPPALSPAADAPPGARRYRRLEVALIHPSNYDHVASSRRSAFVQTYLRGVIPCSTLRVMQSLTLDAFAAPGLAGMETEVRLFEDSIRRQQRAYETMVRRRRPADTLRVVGLVGVQSNQFPRAMALVDDALAHGAVVVIGGPHVTASINAALHGISAVDPMRPGIPAPHAMPPEIQALIDRPGVVVFHGDADADGAWRDVLVELVEGRARPFVEAGLAAHLGAPGVPYARAHLRDFVTPVAAVDTERGCPFKCKFCAAIQAHGRVVRSRAPGDVVAWVRAQCRELGGPLTVLFASDNLARNPHWRELLAGLAALRREGADFTIWAEADVLCDTGPNAGFLEAYAAAGGQGLFLGIESMNPTNLREAGKTQNDIDKLPAFFARCREHNIAPEGGYIIGFEHDTPESVAREAQALSDAGLARAWFFVKTLLPGSEDWVRWLTSGRPMSTDLNEYDSTVPAYEHERMTAGEWEGAYQQAVRIFYSMRNMSKTLRAYADPVQRWRLIKGLMWCRWAYLVERSHPMIAGLYRFRTWGARRPGFGPATGRVRHALAEVGRHARYGAMLLREFYVFQQVILEVEHSFRHDALRRRLSEGVAGARDWFERTFRLPPYRAWLNAFWLRYGGQKWRLLNPFHLGWHLKMVPMALTEVAYTLRFLVLLLRGLRMG